MPPHHLVSSQADLCHAVSNGLACLVAFNAKWTSGVPFLLTEHGLYLRERYLEYRSSAYSFAVRGFVLRFLRLLTAASYVVADFITPGRRLQPTLGDTTRSLGEPGTPCLQRRRPVGLRRRA